MSRDWSQGSSRHWRDNVRPLVLGANQALNGGKCELNVSNHCPKHNKPCTGVCTGMAEQVHHIMGKAYGDRLDNLMAVCKACNLHIGNPGSISPEPQPKSNW